MKRFNITCSITKNIFLWPIIYIVHRKDEYFPNSKYLRVKNGTTFHFSWLIFDISLFIRNRKHKF